MLSSPLRYPGGKSKLFPFFASLIKKNDLFGSSYYEPYAGGAGLAIKLLCSGYVDRISINDIDTAIYAFWQAALHNTDKFCSLIESTPITVDEWRKQKSIWEKRNTKNVLKLGFSTYFLNRTNRSGIIDGAGPIGGYSQSGKWKIDARLSKESQIKNLRELAKYASQIEISNLDALDYLRKNSADRNALIYLDPPYFHKARKLYANFYEPDDHRKVAQYLKKRRKAKWVVSYDDAPEIRAAYDCFSPITYLLNYSAGSKGLGREVIFVSDSIEAPTIDGFKTAA